MARRDKRKRGSEPRSLDAEDSQFTDAMAFFDASGSWPALSEQALSEKNEAAERPQAKARRAERDEPPERLDLHGYSVVDALHRLERFLIRAMARDQRRVVIITGRGRRSSGGVPVLRQKVGEWLRRDAKAWVREVETAPRKLGGDGAWLVYLNRPRPR